MTTIRPAAVEDLDAVLALADTRRWQYATYQPRFWRPAPDAAARQAPYLAGLIADPAVITLVAVTGTVLDGYVIGQLGPAPPVYDPGGLTCMVDDFTVADPALWATVGADLLAAVTLEATDRGASQVVVVTAARDDPKRAALNRGGLTPASEWWVAPAAARVDDPVRRDSHGVRMAPPAAGLPDVHLTAVTAAGERLLLRALGPGDVDELVAGVEDPLTQRWFPLPMPYPRDAAAAWALTAVPAAAAAGTSLVRAIEVAGQLAGIIDLRRVDRATGSAEVSYWAIPGGRGRGVVTAALTVLTGWALTPAPGGLGLGRVEVHAAAGNGASQRVAERAGFTREGLLRRAGRTHGGPVDLVVYSRTVDDPAPGAEL